MSLAALIQSEELHRYKTALEELEQSDEGLTPKQLRVVDRALHPEKFSQPGSIHTHA